MRPLRGWMPWVRVGPPGCPIMASRFVALPLQPYYYRREPWGAGSPGTDGFSGNNKDNMNQRARLARGLAALGLVLASTFAFAQADAAVERAKQLLAAGNAKEAFATLDPLQATYAGQPEFDYLLGVAALDSGRIDDAIIAFERVLAVMPNHAGARMDLARAYYAAGAFDLAEAAFQR